MKVGSLIRVLARWAGLAVLFLVVLEVCARVDDWLSWGAPLWGHYSQELLVVQDDLGMHSRPNARFEKWHVNAHGFRGPEITMQKPAGVARIGVIGASETFGLYENPGMEYPAQMQQMLDAAAPGRYQVLNAGCAGMTLPRFTDYYRAWLKKFEPDVIVICPTSVSYLEEPPPDTKPPEFRPPQKLPETTRLARKVKIIVKRLVPAWMQKDYREYRLARIIRSHEPGWTWRDAPPERVELFRTHLTQLIDEIRRSGAQVVLTTYADRFPEQRADWTETDETMMAAWRRFLPRASEACLLAMENTANQAVFDIGKQCGIPVVDLASVVPRKGENFADFVHFTDAGAQIAAAAVVKRILPVLPPNAAQP